MTLHMFYCVKFKNSGKLSSHLWFFKGFCEQIKPEYCILLDCGLEPRENSIWKMFISMETDKNIGGVCGYMGLKPERNTDEQGYFTDGYEPDEVDVLSDFFVNNISIQMA